jgi:antitoxin MazE
VRLAKPLLAEAGLTDDVEIQARDGALIITSAVVPRAGWAEAAAQGTAAGMLDASSATRFDDEEWAW